MHDPAPGGVGRYASNLIAASAIASGVLFGGLGATYIAYESEIALAQAADSLSDVVAGVGLLWALKISLQPPDEDHPFGHQGAQPIAALVVAVLTGVLAVEVLREAIASMVTGHQAELGWPVAIVLGVKVAAKAVFVRLTAAPRRRSRSILRAIRVDARNDVLVGFTSIVGFVAAKQFDLPQVDAWLAVPVALWIAVSGIMLALESSRLLMGAAPPIDRQRVLADIATNVEGVQGVASIRARHHGNEIHVWVDVRVDPHLSLRAAHDIGEAVERRLLGEEDICEAVAHVDEVSIPPDDGP